jgi:hypothetical protein
MPRWAESLEDVLMSASTIIVGGFAVAIPCAHCLALQHKRHHTKTAIVRNEACSSAVPRNCARCALNC